MARPGWESGTYGSAKRRSRLPLAGTKHGQAVKPNEVMGQKGPFNDYDTTNGEKLQLQSGQDLFRRVPGLGPVGIHGQIGIFFIKGLA